MNEITVRAIAKSGKDSLFGLSLFIARSIGIKTPVGVMEIYNELLKDRPRTEVKAIVESIAGGG